MEFPSEVLHTEVSSSITRFKEVGTIKCSPTTRCYPQCYQFFKEVWTIKCYTCSPQPTRCYPQCYQFFKEVGTIKCYTCSPPASQVLSSVLSVAPLSFKEVETKKVATMEPAPVAPNSGNRTNMAYLSLSQSDRYHECRCSKYQSLAIFLTYRVFF